MASDSAGNSYIDEWLGLLGSSPSELGRRCFSGGLQGSRFRSVAWRSLLRCLSPSPGSWAAEMGAARAAYGELKAEMTENAELADGALDPRINNPLSQEEASPWRQYFWDHDLRGCIEQDVERTFPELEYFQSKTVRKMMVDVLFVYGRQNPHVAYKQGMHEILGPLIFVLFFDQQAFEHASETSTIQSFKDFQLFKDLFDSRFLEHDAFTMFTSVMSVIQPWYCAEEKKQGKRNRLSSESELFARAQDSNATNALVAKLNWIGDEWLKAADPKLYAHLSRLEIAPQIYGLRWLRLLFGREFPIQDLLVLWDAIFADSADFLLVDAIFIAMLIFIRHLLLQSDYTGCLHYLMRYPPVADVHTLLALALHLRNPQTFPKPNAYAFINFSHITVSGRPHPNQLNFNEEAKLRAALAAKEKSESGKTAEMLARNLEKTGIKVLKGMNKVGTIINDNLKDITEQNGTDSLLIPSPSFTTATPAPVRAARPPGPTPTRPRPAPPPRPAPLSEETLALVKEQVSCLQTRLTEVETTAQSTSAQLVGLAVGLRSGRLEAAEAAVVLEELAASLQGSPSRPSSRASPASPGGWVEIGNDVARGNAPPDLLTSPNPKLRASNELKPLASPKKS